MQRLLSELRRRNVFRVAGAYLVMAWLIMQIAAVLESGLGLPDWFDAVVIGFVGLGFPVAILLAWAFEMTPDGIRKTQDEAEETEFRPLGVTDYALIALLVGVVGILSFQLATRNSASSDATPVADTGNPAETVSETSIAVLPFADRSPEGDQQYFSDGIAEELLNALAQFPDLRVAARTSAFSFREETDLRVVGETLGVAHILEGSVRRSGDQLRITAQLIRASDGIQLWSQTYDRTMTDVFAIQDEIVAEISRALQLRLGVGAGEGRAAATNVNPTAYEHYLRGISFWGERFVLDNRLDAIQAFRRATESDPGFADAWASYGLALSGSSTAANPDAQREQEARGLAALRRALEIDPNLARAHSGLAAYYAYVETDPEQALHYSRRATELAPHAAHSNYTLGLVLFRVGDFEAAQRAFDRALTADPFNMFQLYVLFFNLAENGLHDEFLIAWDNYCSGCEMGFDRFNHARRAVSHNGSEAEVRAALTDLAEWLRTQDNGTPAITERIESTVAITTDLTDALLGVEGAGALFSAQLNDTAAIAEDVAVLARLGEHERAIDILFDREAASDPVFQLNFLLTPGRYELPETIRRHPRYHEFWSQPGMAELADMRRANGHTAGLPLPIEDEE